MNNGIILLTGLPVHKGHLQLIRWAASFGIEQLTVLICGRETDPIELWKRKLALTNEFGNSRGRIEVIDVLHNFPDYPEQFDGTVEEFDKLWTDKIHSIVKLDNEDFLFASDTYGSRFASNLGVKFAPFDPNRETTKISATKIRREPFKYFDHIAPFLQYDLGRTITLFGAESVGKTTMAKKLAEKYNAPYVPEWARPYLESLDDPKVTDERMAMIVRGQNAVQKAARSILGSPFIFQDTDLFSTLGYYRIYGGGTKQELNDCEYMATESVSSLYIVMNSNIRFTPDSLRYGIDKRESTDQFWIYLLEEFGCKYYYVQSTNPHAQEAEVEKVIEEFFLKENPVFGFERV